MEKKVFDPLDKKAQMYDYITRNDWHFEYFEPDGVHLDLKKS